MKPADRQFTVIVIGLALIAGALWHLVLDPMRTALESERATLQADRDEIHKAANGPGQDQTERVIEEIEAHATRFEAMWATSLDASGLYEMLQDKARRAGVQIQHIEPRRSTVASDVSEQIKDLGLDVSRITYAIEMVGDYNSIREFFRLFQEDGGLARVDSFRLGAARVAEDPETIGGSITVSFMSISGVFADEGEVAP